MMEDRVRGMDGGRKEEWREVEGERFSFGVFDKFYFSGEEFGNLSMNSVGYEWNMNE